MALGSEAKFCLGFGVWAKFEVGVCAKFEAGFGVGAKTGSGVGRGGGGEGGCEIEFFCGVNNFLVFWLLALFNGVSMNNQCKMSTNHQ